MRHYRQPDFRAEWHRFDHSSETPRPPTAYQVYWMENGIRLTLDRYGILAWSPEGWSHRLQMATLEGHHTVVAKEACRGREAIKHLFSLLLISSFLTTIQMLMVRICHLKGHPTISRR